jgi:DNA repair exonuclease SbcCD ATPase subunit
MPKDVEIRSKADRSNLTQTIMNTEPSKEVMELVEALSQETLRYIGPETRKSLARRIDTLLAEERKKLTAGREVCGVCWTCSHAPAPQTDKGAFQLKDGMWVVCQYCQLQEHFREERKKREGAEKERDQLRELLKEAEQKLEAVDHYRMHDAFRAKVKEVLC